MGDAKITNLGDCTQIAQSLQWNKKHQGRQVRKQGGCSQGGNLMASPKLASVGFKGRLPKT
jgi:hypothetical protein